MRLLRLSCLVAIMVATPALAEDEPEVDCEDAVAQMDMNFCAAKDFEEADKELNRVWKDAVAAARASDADLQDIGDDGRPGYEDTLKAAQRAWIGFRDEWCAYVGYAARGGSMEPMLVSGCLTGLTKTRTRELVDEMEGLGN